MSNSKDGALTEGEFERLWEAAREEELNQLSAPGNHHPYLRFR